MQLIIVCSLGLAQSHFVPYSPSLRSMTENSSNHDPHDGIDADVDSHDPPAVSTPPRVARATAKRGYNWTPVVMGAIVFVVVGVIGSTFKAGQGALVYSKYVDEVLADPARYQTGEVRVEGMVEAGTVQNASGSRDFRFRIERNHQGMPVHYVGIVPDTFREGIGVTVRGHLTPTGVFEASEVVAKCPSKYEMRAASARGETMPTMPGMPAMPSVPATSPSPANPQGNAPSALPNTP